MDVLEKKIHGDISEDRKSLFKISNKLAIVCHNCMGESNTMYNHGFRKYVLIETFLKLLKYIEQIDTQVGTTCQYQKELA